MDHATAGDERSRQRLFAIVSTDIRRDLVAPMRAFTRFRVLHFYRRASYGDLAPDELDASLVPYTSPFDLFRLLWKARPDLLQGVEPFSIAQLPYQAAIFLCALLRRRPLVGGVHISRPLVEKYGRLATWLLKLVLQPYLRYTTLFFYMNEGGRRNLRRMGVPETKLARLMYGTWGVDPTEFTPARDGREPDWEAPPVLLFVGRIHVEKGIFDLLEAFGRVRTAGLQPRLVLVGDGPQREEVETLVRERGWERDVHFRGTVKNRDLPPLLRAATLFISPPLTTKKWEEYVGMTNIQAMACAVPVISTRSGAIPEYVPDGVAGILVPERSPAALAEAISRLLSDPEERRRLGEAGRAHVLACCDARRNVERSEEMLLRVLGDS